MLPFFIGLVCIKPDANPWVRYALLTGINGIPYTHSIIVGLVSRNAKAVGRRAVAAAIYNMTYQIGSIAAVNIYRDGDKPYCECKCQISLAVKAKLIMLSIDYTANKGLIGLCVFNILLFVLAKLYYVWRNRVIERQSIEAPETEKSRMVDRRFTH